MSRLAFTISWIASSEYGTTEAIQSASKASIEGTFNRDVPIVSFVQNVCGLDVSETEIITSNILQLREDSLAKYREILTTKRKYTPHAHPPFHEMVRALLKDICRPFPEQDRKLITCLWDRLGKAELKSRAFRSEDATPRTKEPDPLEAHIPEKNDHLILVPDNNPVPQGAPKPHWSQVRAAVEFNKRKERHSLQGDSSFSSDSDSSIYSRDGSQSRIRSTDSALLQGGTSPAGSPEFVTRPLVSGRRLHDSSTSDPLRLEKRIRVEATKFQLASHALDSPYEGNRQYTADFFIDGLNINIWYYDRTAAMRCVSFDFTTPEGVKRLALSLFALGQSNLKLAGFDPCLYRLTSPPSGHAITAEYVDPVDRPEVNVRKPCYIFFSQVFVNKELSSRFRVINGRGTLVLVVSKVVIDSALSDTDDVLKLSWQEPARTNEGDIITKIRAALPGRCLPDHLFYTKITANDTALPRTQIREVLLEEGNIDKALELDDCDLHFVAKRFKKLSSVRSVDEFKRVFLDCLECHYFAWNRGKALHCDISENNLMICQPDIIVDKDAGSGKAQTAPSQGVLNDFDLSKLDPDGNIRLHHTGTLPFMARDLLAQARNDKLGHDRSRLYETNGLADFHLYRYDLESFYYVLIWAALTYKLRGRSRKGLTGAKNPDLKDWLSPDPKVVYRSKLALQGNEFKNFEVSKEWQGLWKDWVVPLNRMFSKGLFAADEAYRDADANFNAVTCGGLITFEKFMDAIKETPRGLNPVHV